MFPNFAALWSKTNCGCGVAGVHDSWSYVHQCAGRVAVRPVGHFLCDCLRQHLGSWPQLLAGKTPCQGKVQNL